MNNVAYQGIPGSYSYIAASAIFTGQQLEGHSNFHDVFESLKKASADKAVLPIENSVIGSINEVYDLIFEYGYHINSEITLKIDHNLLANENSKLTDITKVYSHPKALEQCAKFIKSHDLSPEIFEDTAAAAAYISLKKNRSEAAIASKEAAKIYNLKILKDRIQNNNQNFTRFVVIEKINNSTIGNKTSIVFVVGHKPGALVNTLNQFAQKGINLTHIESRPKLGEPWNYLFYLDFEHPEGYDIQKLIKKVSKHTKLIKKLGTYKKGDAITENTV